MSPVISHSSLVAAVLAAVALVGATPAFAQGKLDARYVAKLAGVPIGKGTWVVDIKDDQFTALATGGASGLLKVLASGEGKSAASGKVENGRLIPSIFHSSVSADKKTDEVRIALQAGTVKDVVITPTPPPNPERLPLTEDNRRGVIDPMTAVLVRVPGNGALVTAEACRDTVPVFDGQMRFDIKLEFRRIEQVKAEKGYQGPAVVCRVQFAPIAGYIPNRAAIKYLADQRQIEVWLVPIQGTRTLAPFRITLPTPLGTGMLEAVQFVTATQ